MDGYAVKNAAYVTRGPLRKDRDPDAEKIKAFIDSHDFCVFLKEGAPEISVLKRSENG